MARATRRPDPALDLADRLHSAAIHLLRRVRREDARTGLRPARLSALSVVVYGGPVRISALAEAEQVRAPTMTPIVAVLVRATPAGARLLAEGRARRIAALASDCAPPPPATGPPSAPP